MVVKVVWWFPELSCPQLQGVFRVKSSSVNQSPLLIALCVCLYCKADQKAAAASRYFISCMNVEQ